MLDLFCCAGGAAVGYHRAGFDVVGVDINPQPNYPYECYVTDALDVLRYGAVAGHPIEDFAAVHASPPCQHFTKYGNVVKDIKDRYEDLIEPTRELLEATGLPYVIENVEGAPLLGPVTLCGSMFDLDVQRHRLFETNWTLDPPVWPCRHKIWGRDRFPGGRSVARTGSSTGKVRGTVEIGSWDIPLDVQKRAMGVDWPITVRELSEAIPPAYTEFIGSQLLQHLQAERVAA